MHGRHAGLLAGAYVLPVHASGRVARPGHIVFTGQGRAGTAPPSQYEPPLHGTQFGSAVPAHSASPGDCKGAYPAAQAHSSGGYATPPRQNDPNGHAIPLGSDVPVGQ